MKKITKKAVAFIIFIVLIILLAVFLLCREIMNDDVKPSNETLEELDITDEEVSSLLNKIAFDRNVYFRYFLLNENTTYEDIDSKIRNTLSYSYIKEDNLTKVEPTLLDYKIYMERNDATKIEADEYFKLNPIIEFDSKSLENAHKTVFGNNSIYKETDQFTVFGVGVFKYNSTTNKYKTDISLVDGYISTDSYYTSIVDAKKYNNRIEITIAAACYSIEYDTWKSIIKNSIYQGIDKDNFSKSKDLVDKYKFTFIKENDNYYFKKAELINR